jgi:uncharacterized membrane protein
LTGVFEFLSEATVMLLRWLHVIAAIAWIGESFYFVMLDRALRAPVDGPAGVAGELWSVHGGGFYRKQKYAVAPATLPEHLHWSKWKSYTTWLSGAALLAVLYLASPQVFLIDPATAALTSAQAVGAAIALPISSWLVYDVLCRAIGLRDAVLGVAVGLMVLALCYLATQLFAGRAAFVLVGASLATIMSANVLFVIIPGQKRMVAALAAGAIPDPLPGRRGKQRSVHNTYFTLPVVFAMLAPHYATAYAHPQSWLVLALFMAAGAAMRQFFVLWHGGGRAWWLLGLGTLVIAGTLAWLAPVPRPTSVARVEASDTSVPDTEAIRVVLARHCTQCHSARPTLMASAPLGVAYDTTAEIELYAERIHRQVVDLQVMPPGNFTQMSAAERDAIDRWFLARTRAGR